MRFYELFLQFLVYYAHNVPGRKLRFISLTRTDHPCCCQFTHVQGIKSENETVKEGEGSDLKKQEKQIIKTLKLGFPLEGEGLHEMQGDLQKKWA